MDRIEHAGRILEHVIVPKPKDGKAFQAQESIAADIVVAFSMLGTVGLNYQSTFETDKINDVGVDHELTLEFENRHSSIAKH